MGAALATKRTAPPPSPAGQKLGNAVRVCAVVVLGAAVRLGAFALMSPRALALLETRAELASPSTAIAGLREAVYLVSPASSVLGDTLDPWSTPHVHHPPVVVRALAPLFTRSSSPSRPEILIDVPWFGTLCARAPTYVHILFTLADIVTALSLARIEWLRAPARLRAQPRGLHELETHLSEQAALARRTTARRSAVGVPSSVSAATAPTTTTTTWVDPDAPRGALLAALYLLNPITVLTCLALSSTTLYAPFLVGMVCCALACSSAGGSVCARALRQLATAVLVAVNTVFSLYPLLLLPPLSLLAARSRRGRVAWAALAVGLAAALGYANVCLLGGGGPAGARHVWHACYAHLLLLTDLAPNVGLWWYFFTEMFDHFRAFFLLTFNAHLAVYAAPLAIKYRHDPFFAATLLVGILTVFRPYPTAGDSALLWTLLAVHRDVFAYMRHPAVTGLLYACAAVFLPAFHTLWTVAGSGNANFFFASTLVLALAGAGGLLDVLWARGAAEHERSRALRAPPPSSRSARDPDRARGWTRTTVQL